MAAMTPADLNKLPDAELAALITGPWRSTPRRHQQITVAWASDLPRPRAYIASDIGVGKSAAAIYANLYWGYRRLLIVCPNSVVEGWRDEIRKHTAVKPVLLRGPAAARQNLLSDCGGVFVINFEGLKVLFAGRIKTAKGQKWNVESSPLKAAIHEANIDSLIVDEAQNVGEPDSHQTQIVSELSRQADKVLLMSGTPFSRSEDEIWAQYHALDPWWTDEHLGRSLGGFRGRFMVGEKKRTRTHQYTKWMMDPTKEVLLHETIAARTIRFSREQCGDLPPKSYVTRYCDLSLEQERAIQAVADETAYVDPNGEVVNAAVMAAGNKLAQIPGGILIAEPTVKFDPCPKLDLLMEVLAEVGSRKAIVYHTYVDEGRLIEARLRRAGLAFASLRGEISASAKSAGLARFREDKNCRVMVAHPKSGGVGLNLQCAEIVVFYSQGMTGAAGRQQAEGRIWRSGQTRPCLFIDLVARGSLDEKRLETIGNQQAMLDAVLNFLLVKHSKR